MNMLLLIIISLLVINVNSMYNSTTTSTCICTTVPCPVVGTNSLTLAGGGKMSYVYASHNGIAVVSSASGSISSNDLDKGNIILI